MTDGKNGLPRYGVAYRIGLAVVLVSVPVILVAEFFPPEGFRGKKTFPWYLVLLVLYAVGRALVELAREPDLRARMPVSLRGSRPWVVLAALFWAGCVAFFIALYMKFA